MHGVVPAFESYKERKKEGSFFDTDKSRLTKSQRVNTANYTCVKTKQPLYVQFEMWVQRLMHMMYELLLGFPLHVWLKLFLGNTTRLEQ